MKTVIDPRHLKRRRVIQELFSLSFLPQKSNLPLTKRVKARQQEIDKIISKSAPAYPLEKISKIDLAILRLAVFELMTKAAPPKVVINESVELAKEFGNENSYSFINGVLGTILKKL